MFNVKILQEVKFSESLLILLEIRFVWNNGGQQTFTNYSWFSHHVTKIQTKKLSLLLSFYFGVILEHLKTLYKQIFGSKGFFVLRYRTLEFPGFCVTRHLGGGRESS